MTVSKQRRSSAPARIPDEVQQPLRERLLLLRRSRSINRTDVRTLSAGTVRKVEVEDLSSLRVGDLYGLSQEYGVTMAELLTYLVSGSVREQDTRTEEGRRIERIVVHLRSLPDGLQDLAVDLVQRLVGYYVDTTTVRPTTREALRAKLGLTVLDNLDNIDTADVSV